MLAFLSIRPSDPLQPERGKSSRSFIAASTQSLSLDRIINPHPSSFQPADLSSPSAVPSSARPNIVRVPRVRSSRGLIPLSAHGVSIDCRCKVFRRMLLRASRLPSSASGGSSCLVVCGAWAACSARCSTGGRLGEGRRRRGSRARGTGLGDSPGSRRPTTPPQPAATAGPCCPRSTRTYRTPSRRLIRCRSVDH